MRSKISHFKALKPILSPKTRVLILFSGGLDGSYLIKRLQNDFTFQKIIALTVDLGGSGDNVSAQALATHLGVESIVLKESNAFSEQCVIPALKAKATCNHQHPISASLSRPFLAKLAVQVAKAHGCHVILHGANQAQNSLRRFNGAIASLPFQGVFGSPFEEDCISRQEKIAYLAKYNIEFNKDKSISEDTNFWCREIESGQLDNIESLDIPESLFKLTSFSPKTQAQDYIIQFRDGIPISVNHKPSKFVKLVTLLNKEMGPYGLGRYTALEELADGRKFPEIREMPGATLLLDAISHLESAIFPYDTLREKSHIDQLWVKEALEGRWFSPLKQAAESFINELSQHLNGIVQYRVSQGNLQLTGIKAKNGLYGKQREPQYVSLENSIDAL